MNEPIVFVAGIACWGTVVIVWLAGAFYNARRASNQPLVGRPLARMSAIRSFVNSA